MLKCFSQKIMEQMLKFSPRTAQLIFAGALGFTFIATQPAMAFDPTTAMTSVLKFIGLLILVAGAIAAVKLFTSSQIVPAVVVILAAAVLYVAMDPNVMKSIGDGFKSLLGIGS